MCSSPNHRLSCSARRKVDLAIWYHFSPPIFSPFVLVQIRRAWKWKRRARTHAHPASSPHLVRAQNHHVGMQGGPMDGGLHQHASNPNNPDWPVTPREERPYVSGHQVNYKAHHAPGTTHSSYALHAAAPVPEP